MTLVLLSTTQCKVWRQSVSTSNWILMGGEADKGHAVKKIEDGKITLHCEFTKSCYFLSQLPREELADLSRECVYLGDEFGKIGWKTPNYNSKTNPGAVRRFMFEFNDSNLFNKALPLFISHKKRTKLGKKKKMKLKL